jgi:release factor glutamine methyltransferase
MAEIYSPAEDSYFFSEFLKKYLKNCENKELSYLDMGTGSGILSEVVSEFTKKENILAVDINPLAVKFVKSKNFNSIRSNLFENVKNKFDLITFNAPYLPKDDKEPKNSRIATTGGEKGDEISVNFLKNVKNYVKDNGKVLLLVSSLTPMDKIKEFNGKIVAKKELFMEELFILEFSFPYFSK